MVLSMTGFGQAKEIVGNQKFSLELKTLNGKSTDIRLKVPSYYKSKEMIVRRTLLNGIKRGKIDAVLSITSEVGGDEFGINENLYKKYYTDLTRIHSDMGIPLTGATTGILRIPNVVSSRDEEITDDEWTIVQRIMVDAVKSLTEFRMNEGQAMYQDLINNQQIIKSSLEAVAPYESERVAKLRERLMRNLLEFKKNEQVDQNRFEQEVIYYLEKLDINEEKIRLAQHCQYFEEVIKGDQYEKGKKLAFISQEMGREINTLGAKAQHSEIQQIVVQMKEALEKIKEQVANIV